MRSTVSSRAKETKMVIKESPRKRNFKPTITAGPNEPFSESQTPLLNLTFDSEVTCSASEEGLMDDLSLIDDKIVQIMQLIDDVLVSREHNDMGSTSSNASTIVSSHCQKNNSDSEGVSTDAKCGKPL